MAKRTIVTTTDDLDPTKEATQNVEFGIDGAAYEIDLTDANAAKIRSVLAEFIAAARRTGRPPKPPRAHVRRLHPDDARDIRVWVREHGGTIKDKGRIPEHHIDAYYDNNRAAVR